MNFEEIVNLCNDGRGMLPSEQLIALRLCLKGQRRKIYDMIVKEAKKDGTYKSDPETVYKNIKSRHTMFKAHKMSVIWRQRYIMWTEVDTTCEE